MKLEELFLNFIISIYDAYWWPQFSFTSVAIGKRENLLTCCTAATKRILNFIVIPTLKPTKNKSNEIYQFQITIPFICPTQFVDTLISLGVYDIWCEGEQFLVDVQLHFTILRRWLLHFARHKPLIGEPTKEDAIERSFITEKEITDASPESIFHIFHIFHWNIQMCLGQFYVRFLLAKLLKNRQKIFKFFCPRSAFVGLFTGGP